MRAPNTLRLVLMLYLGIPIKVCVPPVLDAPNRELNEKHPLMESAERNLNVFNLRPKLTSNNKKPST